MCVRPDRRGPTCEICVRMTGSGNRATGRISVPRLLIATILLVALCAASTERSYMKSHMLEKLCSKSLSDALYAVCRDRGYNGPFPSSDEDEEEVDPTGPGLVEECCYHRCTYATLERYCKPLPKEKQVDSREAIEEFRVKLPYSVTTTKEMSAEQRSQTETDHADGAIKRKVDDLKEERHKGKGDRNVDGVCKGKADAKKRHCGRHCRCRRRRLKCRRAGKISRGNVKPCAG